MHAAGLGFEKLLSWQREGGAWSQGLATGQPGCIAATIMGWQCVELAAQFAPTWIERMPALRDAAARAQRWLQRTVGSLHPRRLMSEIRQAFEDDVAQAAGVLVALATTGRLGDRDAAWRLLSDAASQQRRRRHDKSAPPDSAGLLLSIIVQTHRHRRRPESSPLPALPADQWHTLHADATPLIASALLIHHATHARPASDAATASRMVDAICERQHEGAWAIDSNHDVRFRSIAGWSRFSQNDDGSLSCDADQSVAALSIADQVNAAAQPMPLGADGPTLLAWRWRTTPDAPCNAIDSALAAGFLASTVELSIRRGDSKATLRCERAAAWIIQQPQGSGAFTAMEGQPAAAPAAAADATAVAVLALHRLRPHLRPSLRDAADQTVWLAARWLHVHQLPDGHWDAASTCQYCETGSGAALRSGCLWATCLAAEALAELPHADHARHVDHAVRHLLRMQTQAGGWSPIADAATIEHTAMAIAALARIWRTTRRWRRPLLAQSIHAGVNWLRDATGNGAHINDIQPIWRDSSGWARADGDFAACLVARAFTQRQACC